MNKLTSFLAAATTATAVVASEANLEKLEHLNQWQWTKDHEVCDTVLRPDQVARLSPGARAKYEKNLKAVVAGYDAWEEERQEHLKSLSAEERKAYDEKNAAAAERKERDPHRCGWEQMRAREVATKLALARGQLDASATRGNAGPAMGELLKFKIQKINEHINWAGQHFHRLGREVDAYGQLAPDAAQEEQEIAKFRIRLEKLDIERDVYIVEQIKATMTKDDLDAYESDKKADDELARIRESLRHGRDLESQDGRNELIKEAEAILGG